MKENKMKPCYECLKEMSWCWWDKKENVKISSNYRDCYPLFWLSHKMKPCYEGLKEIRVDVDELWRKMLDFKVSIGLLPLVLIDLIKWNPVMKVWKKLELMLISYEGKC